jgi:hypothetical protein
VAAPGLLDQRLGLGLGMEFWANIELRHGLTSSS